MKVLLGQNLDHRLRIHLGSHEVFTASYKGWEELKNGKLLDAAEEEGFDVRITGDKTLSYEQNLTGRRLAIVALSAVEWRIIKDYLQRITAAVDSAAPGSFQVVDCAHSAGRRSPAGKSRLFQKRSGVMSCRLVPVRRCFASRRQVAKISISTRSAASRLSSAMNDQIASRFSVACGVN